MAILPRYAPHWKYDLPHPNERLKPHIDIKSLRMTPNHIDDKYLEIPRSTLRVRGIGVLGGGIVMIIITAALAFITYSSMTSKTNDLDVVLICCGLLCGLYWLVFPSIRFDLESPRDEPVRFNRRRRKVYFYQFKFDRIWILSRCKWGVQVESHDWDDLVAEACSVYVPGHGGLIENIMIAVHKPGTDDVIARYFFAHDIEEGTKYWALVRLYMQQGPQSLPDFVHPPRDWNNDNEVSLIRRFAPKVQWPKEMDVESRSAPSTGEI